ncbi:MAG: universal stress protein [Steroidobacteraceae bacterium]
MSWKIRRILVAIGDPWHVPPAQLRKAAQLANAVGAHLELCHAIHPANAQQVGAARARMERLGSRKVFAGLDVRTCLAIDAPAHDAIVRRASLIRADLIIAATASHRRGERLWLRNTDWELIRHAPCPLLLVKAPRRWRAPAVLASVDPFHARAKPAQLDPRLLESATAFAHWLGGKAHAFHAYLPLVAAMPGAMGQPVALTLPPDAEAVHGENVRRTFDALVARSGIPAARRHLRMGDVPTQLVATVRRARVQIVVMGAVSRSALRRLFIGSTAEHMLDRLPCDVLIIKPKT